MIAEEVTKILLTGVQHEAYILNPLFTLSAERIPLDLNLGDNIKIMRKVVKNTPSESGFTKQNLLQAYPVTRQMNKKLLQPDVQQ